MNFASEPIPQESTPWKSMRTSQMLRNPEELDDEYYSTSEKQEQKNEKFNAIEEKNQVKNLWETFSDEEKSISQNKSMKEQKKVRKQKKINSGINIETLKLDQKSKMLKKSKKNKKFKVDNAKELLENETTNPNSSKFILEVKEEENLDDQMVVKKSNAIILRQKSKRNDQQQFLEDKLPRCFACREVGHSIKYCINIQNDAKNFCLKCGDPKHSYQKCSIKEPVYNFATCFICKNKGHISSQCKEKTHGIYPDGGSCKCCKSVDHFVANCPKLKMRKNSKKKSNKFNKYKHMNGKKQHRKL